MRKSDFLVDIYRIKYVKIICKYSQALLSFPPEVFKRMFQSNSYVQIEKKIIYQWKKKEKLNLN